MKKIIIVLIFVSVFCEINSQTYTVKGYVIDSISNETIIGATIYDSKNNIGTTTNNYGFYSLTVSTKDSIFLTISSINHKIYHDTIYIFNNISAKNYYLSPTDYNIGNVVISSKKIDLSLPKISTLNLSPKDIQAMPMLGGEVDIFKAFQLMPGVMQGNEGKSGLIVRGGSPDQNLILLDDAPLYHVNHLGGFISVFNNDALKNVELYKGVFPARYSNRISSVVDIRMKDGDMNNFHKKISIGLLSSKIFIEGPIVKNKISFMFSARKSMLDLTFIPALKLFKVIPNLNYNFYDINTKINYKINDKDRIFFSFYKGNDHTKNSFDHKLDKSESYHLNDLKWGNTILALRWNHIFGRKLFSNVILNYSKYQYFSENIYTNNLDSVRNESSSYLSSSIQNYSLKFNFEYNVTKGYTINFGANFIQHNFSPANINYFKQLNSEVIIDTNFLGTNYRPVYSNIYLENKIILSKFLSANFGLRASAYSDSLLSSFDTRLEPSIITNFRINSTTSLKAGASVNCQYVHLLSFSGTEFFSDIWVPATKEISSQNSSIVELSFEKLFTSTNIKLQTGAYYKVLSGLIHSGYGSFWENAYNWQKKSEKNGKGTVYGFEILLKKSSNNFNGWIAYSYSKSMRTFENLNNGEPFPYEYDRPHDFKVFLSYKISEKITLSSNWIFQSGKPFNMPAGIYNSFNTPALGSENLYNIQPTQYFTQLNSIRIKPYHRLDFAINFTKKKPKYERVWSLSIYNVYNRQNAYFYFLETVRENDKYVVKLFQQSLFPIIPSVSYSLKF